MLVLSRKKEETILIGDQIELKILRLKGNVVKIGINAPAEYKVMRGEIAPFGLNAEGDSDRDPRVENDQRPLAGKIRNRQTSAQMSAQTQSVREPIIEDLTIPDSNSMAHAG